MTSETKVELTMEQKLEALKGRMQAAAALGDLDAIIAIGKEADILKKSTAKAENEKILARAKELEGARLQFSEKLEKITKAALAKSFPNLDTDLAAIDGIGLHILYTVKDNVWAIGGTFQQVKSTKTGKTTSGGRTGKTSAEFGKTLNDIFEEFADQVGDITSSGITGTPRDVMAAVKETDSANGAKAYMVKKAVKGAAIEKGLLKA